MNGTTKNSIDAAGKNPLPIRAIGMRIVSMSWNRAWVRASEDKAVSSGRYGLVRVLRTTALIYGAGLLAGTFLHALTPLLVGLPIPALAGAIVMTLPQALAFTLAPPGSSGTAAGIVDFTRGIGVVLGPVVAGAAIATFRDQFASTDGYAAMWPVIAVPVLASVLVLRLLQPRPDADSA